MLIWYELKKCCLSLILIFSFPLVCVYIEGKYNLLHLKNIIVGAYNADTGARLLRLFNFFIENRAIIFTMILIQSFYPGNHQADHNAQKTDNCKRVS